MKIRVTSNVRSSAVAATLLCLVAVAGAPATTPQYQIYDIGVVQVGDTASQGFGVSDAGIAVGRSVRTGGSQAFTWTVKGGIVGLPNLAGRSYAVSNSANDNGIVVGTAATTLFGSSRLPVIWQNGVVSQLPLPPGETLGDANSVNSSTVAVGSVDAGSLQRGVIYSGGSATIITQTTANGSYFLTAFGINDSGRIVGQGIDPQNAARNVGIVYDIGQSMAFEVGALPGMNGALAFGVSNTGYVVGSSMLNQGSGLPFIWSDQGGIVAIPLAPGTTQGSGRAVNSTGWVVGNDSSAFSIPFLYDGTTTYRLADLIPPNSGWDLSMNTSSSALGISEDGIIVGTGVHNSDTHAYAMVPMAPSPTPTPTATPCPSDQYTILSGTDTILPGTTDSGNHCDDCDTLIALPFNFELYGQTFNSANISSNGRLEFVCVNDPSGYITQCLPAPPVECPFDYTIFPLWQDMRTDAGLACSTWPNGCGVFTSVSGTAPNRIFNIEWHAVLSFAVNSAQNFEVRLYENDPNQKFEVILGTLNTTGAKDFYVSGVQGAIGFVTPDFCNPIPPQNVSRTYTLQGCGSPTPTPTATPTVTVTPTPTATATATTTATPTGTQPPSSPTPTATPTATPRSSLTPRATPAPRPRPTLPPRP